MLSIAIAIHVIVSLLIIAAVLLHSGKGASMGSSFGGSTSSQALFGSAGPATILTKITAACAVIFMITSIYISYMSAHSESSSIMQDVPSVQEEPSQETPVKEAPSATDAKEAPAAAAAPAEKKAEAAPAAKPEAKPEAKPKK